MSRVEQEDVRFWEGMRYARKKLVEEEGVQAEVVSAFGRRLLALDEEKLDQVLRKFAPGEKVRVVVLKEVEEREEPEVPAEESPSFLQECERRFGVKLGDRVRVERFGDGVVTQMLELKSGPMAVVKIEPSTTWCGGFDEIEKI